MAQPGKANGKTRRQDHGQALVEFVGVLTILAVMMFGLIDFGRFIYERLILANVSREGANLASRGETMTNAMTAVIASAQPLDLGARGRVIMTSVVLSNGSYQITAQVSQGGIAATSHIGTSVGGSATLPATAVPIPQPSQTLYAAEVFYTFTPITPVGKLLHLALPTRVYDVAYFCF